MENDAMIQAAREERGEMVERYRNGEGLVALEKSFHMNKAAIRKILVAEGVTIRGKGRPKSKLKDAIAEMEVDKVLAKPNANPDNFNPDGSSKGNIRFITKRD